MPQRDPDPAFIGRQWLFADVKEHLASELPTNRGVTVTGSPGTGKTAIILKLVEQSCFGRGEPIYQETPKSSPTHHHHHHLLSNLETIRSVASEVVAYHFCQAENAPTCAVAEFVHSLAAQLSQAPALRPYHNLLMSDYQLRTKLTLGFCLSKPEQALEEGILEPLRSVQGVDGIGTRPCIIIIDSLCDSETHKPDRGDTIGSFIGKTLDSFPPWVKFVVTARSDSRGLKVVKCLPFHQISLDKSCVDERVKKDINDYISSRIAQSQRISLNVTPSSGSGSSTPGLGRRESASVLMQQQQQQQQQQQSPQNRFCHHLTELANGNFLYAKLCLDLIESGHLVIKSSSFNVLPVSLSEVFRLEFNLRFPSQPAFAKAADILSVCLASEEPLSVADIYQSVLAVQPELTWTEFVTRFNALSGVLVRRGDDTVMFYHPLVREWLIRRVENGDNGKFVCDRRAGHAALAVKMSRGGDVIAPEKTLQLAHHILQGRLYEGNEGDVSSLWLAHSAHDLSEALGCQRNIYSPNVNASRLLLLSGASAHFTTGHLHNSPVLTVFAEQGNEEMVALLLDFGADPDARNSEGITPLMFAASRGHLEIVRMLMEAGAAINKSDRHDQSALVFAAQSGHLHIVEYLVSYDWPTGSFSAGGEPSFAPSDLTLAEATQQALIAAAAHGRFQVVEYLLDMPEVDVNASETLKGETALCAAAASGQRRCCEILLRRGAQMTAANLKDVPPLHIATKQGHWSVVDLLAVEKEVVEQRDGAGKTALMFAAAEGHLGLVELLLSRGTELENTDKEGMTSLGWACLKGQSGAAELLIAKGANINHADKNGRSPLDLAAYKGDSDIVQMLLESGAVMEHVDINGMRPLDRAIGCRNAMAVQCFLKKGAKLGPATWAMANGKPDIM